MQTMREDAETILREAVAAAQPGRLVREVLAAERLTGRIVLLAAGKAAWAMAQAACACVPVWRGIVITKDGHLGGTLPPLELAEAGHPVPDARAFAPALRALVSGCRSNVSSLSCCVMTTSTTPKTGVNYSLISELKITQPAAKCQQV